MTDGVRSRGAAFGLGCRASRLLPDRVAGGSLTDSVSVSVSVSYLKKLLWRVIVSRSVYLSHKKPQSSMRRNHGL
jgi:hypothetical protein